MNDDGNSPEIIPYHELMKLTKEEFINYNRAQQAWARKQPKQLSPGYSVQSREGKVKHWSGNLGQQMRWQAESGLDPYAGYSPEWHEDLLTLEPDLDALIKEAFRLYLSWEWSYTEYCHRVGLS